ncbi:MAG: tetratricopeptide repeat protein, partial [Thiofilum sp.]
SLAIREKLAAHDPQQVEWQRDLSVSYNNVGDIQQAKGEQEAALRSYQQSLAIREKLAAHDPQQVEWQRDLSVSYDKVGAIQQAKGEQEAALRSYQQSLAIREKLAAHDPNVVEWQTDLVASYYRLAQLQPDKARQYMQQSLTILQRLKEQNKLSSYWLEWVEITEQRLAELEQKQ